MIGKLIEKQKLSVREVARDSRGDRMLGQRIREYRERRGLTQDQLAKRLNRTCHWSTINRIENGHGTAKITVSRLRQIARNLDVTMSALLKRID